LRRTRGRRRSCEGGEEEKRERERERGEEAKENGKRNRFGKK